MDTTDVLVQNVQALPLMPQKHVVADVQASSKVAEIILWQEINKKRYRDAVKNLGPEWGHLMVRGMGNIGGCPISWHKTRYREIQRGKEKLTRGWPGICGARYLTWVCLKDLDNGAVFIVLNFHFPAGAWSKKWQTMRKRRQRMWNKSLRVLRDFITEWVLEGYPIIGGGDLNRMYFKAVGTKVLGQKVTYATAESSIDELFFISSENVSLGLLDVDILGRFSDHAGRKATLSVEVVENVSR